MFIIPYCYVTMSLLITRSVVSDSMSDSKISTIFGGMTMADDNRCGHDACACAVSGDQEYCSDHCRNAADQDITEISCDCGHSGCGIL